MMKHGKEWEKLQQTTNYKLNQIERTDNIKESVDALGQNAVKIDRLLKEAENKVDKAEAILPTTTASGENVYIDNAVNYPLMSLSGEGKCEQGENPSPDNPQEITTISEAEYKGVGKNLIDLTQINFTSAPIKLASSGCTISDKNINSMVLTAVGTWSNAYLDFQENYFKENEDVVISAKFLETISGRTSQVGFTIQGSDDGSTYSVIKADSAHVINYNVSTKISTSINVGTYKYIRIRIWANATATSVTSGGSVINVSELMVARGTDDTYEPYQESTLPIDLQGNELCELDKLLIDRKGNVAIEKNLPKLVLDGSEDWITTTGYTGFYRYILYMTNLVRATSAVYGMNTHFTQRINQAHGAYEYLFVQRSPNGGAIYIQSENLATVEELKAWLQENNVTVYYQLATPQIINLGTIENPEIFKGVNNIVVETNLGNMNVEIEYVEDLQARLEKVEQAIIS